jgi:hypothetical protein
LKPACPGTAQQPLGEGLFCARPGGGTCPKRLAHGLKRRLVTFFAVLKMFQALLAEPYLSALFIKKIRLKISPETALSC